MAFDSTANLLFTIGANADDATATSARFRSLLGKDLDALESEFAGWANSVFGSLGTVKGALIGTTAALAGALVGVAAAASKATDRYVEYVGEVAKGSRVTGIAIDQMSVLAVAADNTHTNFEAVTHGLALFASKIVEASGSVDAHSKSFGRMRISQEAVKAGQKDMLPLLGQVMDGFRGLSSGVERAAMARDLFGRGGTEMLSFLRIGSEGLKNFREEAEKLGLALTSADVDAVRRYKAALNELQDRQQALDVAVGRSTIGIKTSWEVLKAALVETLTGGGVKTGDLFVNMAANFGVIKQGVEDTAKALGNFGDASGGLEPVKEKVKEATQEFTAFSDILDSIQQKMASGDEESRAAAEIQHLVLQAGKAANEMARLRKEGTLLPEAYERESATLLKVGTAIAELSEHQDREIAERRRQAAEEAGEDLAARITAQRDRSFAQEYAAWASEIEKLRIQLTKKKALTAENAAALAELEEAGRAKIAREQGEAWRQEMVSLQTHLAQIVTARMTARERLEFELDQELAKYSDVEKQKAMLTAKGIGEMALIEGQFAINRAALYQKFAADLQALKNSEGWQGVLGAPFGQLLRHDEAAWREWATSANQATLMVRASLVALKGMGMQAFQSLAQGMGSNIAHALVYEESIGKAMRGALAATLETIAAESLVQAIYATALGFLRLAQHDPVGAAAAFHAAGVFAIVGGVAAAAGRAVAPHEGASAGAAGGSGGAGESSDSTGSQAAQNAGPRVYVNIEGHVIGLSGAAELAAILTEAVEGGNARLTASGTLTGRVERR